METNRQKKIAGILQQDIALILQEALRKTGLGIIITVTKVSVTPDLLDAKVYISVFPTDKREAILKDTQDNTKHIKHQLAQRTRRQLRRVPDLRFYIDDSLDYIESIEKALKGETDNPIKNPEILPKRKKL